MTATRERRPRGSEMYGRVHPTPAHIRACIMEAIYDADDKRLAEGLPPMDPRFYAAIRRGIAQACQEHDEGKL